MLKCLVIENKLVRHVYVMDWVLSLLHVEISASLNFLVKRLLLMKSLLRVLCIVAHMASHKLCFLL